MAKQHPKTIKHRFVVGLSVIMAVLGTFFAVVISMNLRNQLVTDTEHKASLILSQAEALQAYVKQVLRPSMYDLLPPDGFLLEAMSTSYVTRKVMSDLNVQGEQYRYRRVALGARNPDYEADGFERGLMDRFARDPDLARIEEITDRNGEEVFVAARPVRLDATCLHCHGDPAEAPRAMLARYGAERGFWRHDGELVGVDAVTMPVAGALGQVKGATVSFLALFALGLAVFYLTVQVFFDRLVVVNLGRVTEVMRRYFPKEAGEAPRPAGGDGPRPAAGDGEIEEIYDGIEAFASRLKEAREKIEDHAQNLERKVADRTLELAREADERRADVALFVELLSILNLSQTRAELLGGALARIAGRFGAVAAAYECEFSGGGFVSWPPGRTPPPSPPGWRRLVAEDSLRLTDDAAYIPVRTTDVSRGLLRLYFPGGDQGPDPEATELYRAIGQQLGIALENLDAINSLLGQNTLLASIFDGISDPLALLDSGYGVIMANEPARELARALARELADGGDCPAAPAVPVTPLRLPPEFFGPAVPLPDKADTPPLERPSAIEPSASTITLPGGRTFAVTRYPLASPSGQDGRMVVYARENTAERRMREKMRQTEKLVAVGKLAAGLAHEINNPLGVISCYAELLRQSLTDPQAREDLAVIERHAVMAKKVLRDLLDFARPRQATPGPCDLAALVASLSRIFDIQAQARRVRLSTRAPAGLPLANADASALEQVLSNLLLNALDAVAPDQGEIVLEAGAGPDARTVYLRVADNGPGIAPEDTPRIFDPFFTTKEAGRGSGLGLAVVYGLLRDMNGRIEVENSGGAVFTVTLPACPRPGPGPEEIP
jgi:signal transduction histidine kinase